MQEQEKQENKIIDLNLGAHLVRKDAAFAKEMIETLVGTFPAELEKLNAAHTDQAWETVRDTVHRIKGAASYCGTPRLQKISQDFLHYLHAGETADREKLYADFISEIHAVINAYKAL